MELALVIKELLCHKRLLALGVCLALLAAILSVYRVQLLPPKLIARGLVHSAASTQVYVDSHDPLAGDLEVATTEDAQLATVYANLMASPGAMELVGRRAGIPGDQIWAAGPVDPNSQRVQIEPTATKRDVEIVGDQYPYRLEFLTDPSLPIVNIYSQAPTTAQAIALANASVATLRDYVKGLEAQAHTRYGIQAVLRSIGGATGGVVNPGIAKKLAGMTFVLVLIGWCVLVLIGVRLVSGWRQATLVQGLEDAFKERKGTDSTTLGGVRTKRLGSEHESRR